MDDTSGKRRHQAIGVNVGHDIVASPLLLQSSGRELLVFNHSMFSELFESFVADLKAKLLLGFGQVYPELAPCAEAVPRGENILHLLRGIPRVERVVVTIELRIHGDGCGNHNQQLLI